MPKDKVELHRDYYPLAEAAELAGLKLDDLLHMAANGKLPVSVIADQWMVASVYEIDPSFEYKTAVPALSFKGPELPNFPEPGGSDFLGRYKEWKQIDDSRDLIVGSRTVYGRQGGFGVFYSNPLRGTQPVAISSFAGYLVSRASAKIELDLNRILGVADEAHERFIRPDPDVLVQDALNQDKFVVLKDDLHHLIVGDRVAPDDAKTEGAVSRKTLLKLVIGMAKAGYSYDPERKKNDSVGDIERDLQSQGIPLDQDSIRKALREATTLLPEAPQKT